MPTSEPPRTIVRRTTEQVPCLQRAKTWIKGNLQPSSASRGDRFLQAGKIKTPVGKIPSSATVEPRRNRFHVCSVQKHGSKETCNLLQRAGVTESCRLEGEKKSGEKSQHQNHQENRLQNHRTGSMFAACRAWIEGNLQSSSASRSERFLQPGKREKPQWGKKRNANHRTTEK